MKALLGQNSKLLLNTMTDTRDVMKQVTICIHQMSNVLKTFKVYMLSNANFSYSFSYFSVTVVVTVNCVTFCHLLCLFSYSYRYS